MTPEELDATIQRMPVDICGPERDAFIIENAEYYTIAFYLNRAKHQYKFTTLHNARFNAQIAANKLNKHILIYAVLGIYPAYVGTVPPE